MRIRENKAFDAIEFRIREEFEFLDPSERKRIADKLMVILEEELNNED